ncbi:unnamed protein product [Cyclocybe aegerita]|uniref:Uncharacterized protein n=1 Tax=Cyclocybe aegerita TaxID=1973307 RepID=A0A8S0W304_CYCAE|nr:unnamed protein product [Cyclocybe aegerita]
MALQPPSPSSSYHKIPMPTLQYLDVPLYGGARVYSAFGTSHEQVLYPRKDARLVRSRPRKPVRVVLRVPTPPRKKIQWPDAHNVKEVAAFCANELDMIVNGRPVDAAENDPMATKANETEAATDNTTIPKTAHLTRTEAPTNCCMPSLQLPSRIPRLSTSHIGRGTKDA